MSLYIPADITNIIFEYLSHLKDMKWTPFIDSKTGKLKWKVNKFCSKNIALIYNNIISFNKYCLKEQIQLVIIIQNNDQIINQYMATGIITNFKSGFNIEFTDENYFTYYIVSFTRRNSFNTIYINNTIFGTCYIWFPTDIDQYYLLSIDKI